jgi:cation diffusion facilitator CzcD-associated flavoprotein CzcO
VKKHNLDRDLKLEHELVGATWNEKESKWKLEIQNHDRRFGDECDILVSARGFLNKWRWPSIEGLHLFQGKLLHSANWDHSYDFSGKKVALIGNGSSAIQILPKLAPEVKQITNYFRNPTWITSPTHKNTAIGGKDNHIYTEEEREKFRSDPKYLHEYRKMIQSSGNMAFARVHLQNFIRTFVTHILVL